MSHCVVLVGHCGIDGPRLERELTQGMSETRVLRVNSETDLKRCLEDGADLLLINREPVGFDRQGVDLVREVCRDNPDAKVMLVSDYSDAQQEAVSAGALPGFGKSTMGRGTVVGAVKKALGD
jgi:DNA-binding NarL/FixJ family response regulator